jgi:predicted DsbA family dithiol-disulfide isomerase
MIDRVEAVAAEEGLLFRLGEARRGNTWDAHRLLHLALDEGAQVQGRLKEELLSAYFLRAENVADHDVLRRAAAGVGLEPGRVDEVLAGDEYADVVEQDIRRAGALGATGVPFFVIDDRYGIPGAQPAEVFTQVLEKAWTDAHPGLDLAGATSAGEACGPDDCAW